MGLRFCLISAALVLLGASSFAQPVFAPPTDPLNFYFKIHENSPRIESFSAPMDLLDLHQVMEAALNLLAFDSFKQPFPEPTEPYNRLAHFGTWVRDPRDKTCFNTRAKVLMRDSKTQVIFNEKNRCLVASGTWNEPYTGQVHTLASEIQIDHLVPLKNAYTTGASRWDWLHRCLYANYIGNPFHLVSADGSQNMRKGDRTPADWMPPNKQISCAYLSNWLQVKLIWGLVIAPREASAIQNLARQSGCNPAQFQVSSSMPREQRKVIADNLNLCAHIRPGFSDNPEGNN